MASAAIGPSPNCASGSWEITGNSPGLTFWFRGIFLLLHFRLCLEHGISDKPGWRRLLDRFKDNLTPQQFLFHALRTSYQ
jgi:hypothetical protein